jgi:hypothetical protein
METLGEGAAENGQDFAGTHHNKTRLRTWVDGGTPL